MTPDSVILFPDRGQLREVLNQGSFGTGEERDWVNLGQERDWVHLGQDGTGTGFIWDYI